MTLMVIRIQDPAELRIRAGQLDAVIDSLVKSAVDAGILRVLFYPSIEAAHAALILARNVERYGVNVSVHSSSALPEKIDEPTLLIGYSKIWTKKKVSVSDVLVCIGDAVIEPPPPNGTCIEVKSSIGTAVAAVLSGRLPFNEQLLRASYIAPYTSGLFVNPSSFWDIDKAFLEDAVSSKLLKRIESYYTYAPIAYDVVNSISNTLEPYLPGFTGTPKNVYDELRYRNKQVLAGKNAENMEFDEKKEVLDIIMTRITEHAKSKISAETLSGILYYYPSGHDLLTASKVLVYTTIKENSFTPFYRFLEEPILFTEHYMREYEKDMAEIAEQVRRTMARHERLDVLRWLSIYKVNTNSPETLHIIGYNLRFYGLIPSDAFVASEDEHGLYTTLPEIERTVGKQVISRLERVDAGKIDGLKIRLNVS